MRILLLSTALLVLAACSDYTPVKKEAKVNPVTREITPPAPCPDWSQPTENYDNSVHSNFGCATAKNTVIQLADPADAVRGQGDNRADTEQSVRTLQRYRAGEIPAPLLPMSELGN